MPDYHYKSDTPATVAVVQAMYQAKDELRSKSDQLGKLFGGAIAPMRSITDFYAGGVKLGADRSLDVHWRRPDEYGYRELRAKAMPPKGTEKKERAAIHAEHERLQELWRSNYPERVDVHSYWQQLTVNTGNLLLCGGVMFEHQGVAYFHMGFEINKADHESKVAAGKPTSGWIEGAIEIFPREYEAAREAKQAANV